MRWRDFDELTVLPDEFFKSPRKVHFIGIGGIGMSALAFVLQNQGHAVSGSDASESAMLEKLRAAGIVTAIGHRAENSSLLGQPADAIIFGSAISDDNPERAAQSIPQWHRAQLLAHFVNNAQMSIAVSGTHGKSTTSAMIAHILAKLNLDPTAILGAEYPPFGSNVRLGNPDLIVVEADESDGSFTLLKPGVAVILNIEPEHLENYDNSEAELWRAFEMFAASAKTNVVLNADDPVLRLDKNDVTYGLKNRDAAVRANGLQIENARVRFGVEWGDAEIGDFFLGVPGEHNVSNALAAMAATAAATNRLSEVASAKNPTHEFADLLADFHGVKRRFERVGEAGGILIYNDYAHHPTEVKATLEAARDFLQRPILAIFQPHRYSRTQQLGREFGTSFSAADKVIVTELYSAWEEPIAGVSGKIVFDAVREKYADIPAYFCESLEAARELALKIAQRGDAIFCLGAGDIGALPAKLLSDLEKRESQLLQPKNGAWHELENLAKRDEPLSRHCTIRVGGAAQFWLEPQSEDELAHVLQLVQKSGAPLTIFGAGSNLVPSDNGFDGVVLKLGNGFATHRVDGDLLIVGGALLLPKLTHLALDNNLGNLEWACGVPGTVGGSVRGNAGARGWNGRAMESRDCAADLHSLVAFSRDGKRHELKRDEIEFSYRKSSLGELLVTQATFKLQPLSDAQMRAHREAVKELLRIRRETQPANAASAGCIWKNPQTCGAGALVESLGLKGRKVGGAQVSELHANFIINMGEATGEDVRELAAEVESIAREQRGIVLEREARFLD